MSFLPSESASPTTQPSVLSSTQPGALSDGYGRSERPVAPRSRRIADALKQRWRQARLGWRADETVDGASASRFRARQLYAVYQFTPLACVVNLGIPPVIAYSFWNQFDSHGLVVLWLLAMWACVGFGARGWLMLRKPGVLSSGVPTSEVHLTTAFGLIYGMLWCVVPMTLFGQAQPKDQLLLGCMTAGLIAGGGLVFATVVPAAMAFIGASTVWSIIVLLQAGGLGKLALLVGLYAFTLSAIVVAGGRIFLSNLRAEAKTERQSQTIGLLLRDFEEHASDWLWEVSVSGRLRHVSLRLAQSLGRPVESLVGEPMLDLMVASLGAMTVEEREAIATLRHKFKSLTPFQDLAVPARIGQERRWWSLTAKPLFDERGRATGWRGVGTDVTHARQAHLEMVRMANFDALTGLANRHQFGLQLDRVRDSAHQPERACALLFLDLDNFKHVNDSMGHAIGDRLLYMVAKRLATCAGPGDLLARLGGDEFALISWNLTDPEEVAALAERLLDCFSEPYVIDGASIEVATSVGIAIAPLDGADPHTLLKNADLALYAAKAAGRHTYRFFDQQMEERSRERMSMQRDLREALNKGELDVYFQPQINTATDEVSGFEALVRWHHPRRGWVAPGEFIPLAEETGLIAPLGRWVLHRACQAAGAWPDELRVAVNLSALQFRSSSVLELVSDALTATGLPPHRLELEITESALVQDSSTVRATLMALRRRGVRVALDDFGTGYSSLAYLRTFPLDKLKIDVMFVRALGTDAGDDMEARAILRAIVSLAEALQLETTAEGVETEAQMQAVRELGCTHVQGYLAAKPMSAQDLAVYLRAAGAG